MGGVTIMYNGNGLHERNLMVSYESYSYDQSWITLL